MRGQKGVGSKDKVLAKFIKERGLDMQSQLDTMGMRTEEHNPQTVYSKFKRDILEFARNRERVAVPKSILKQRNLEAALERIINDANIPEDEKTRASGEITEKIAKVERERHQGARSIAATRNRIEGETICASWTKANKAAKPRDMIYALRKPMEPETDPNGPAQYEKNSQKMAELARDYHENLQIDENLPAEELREEKIRTVLENITAKTTDEQFEAMKRQLLEEDVAAALKNSQNNRAAGLDGATYELWKTIHTRYLEDIRGNRQAFNLIGLMTRTFNDIESFGVVPSTNFSEGWMCPIYKKNDRNEIANYRPITLLNTDYKIMTKAMAMKLTKAAPTLIHKNQVGFVPGRQIKDQTMLVRMMMDYAEATEQNGLIVALDQEKAYNKVAHDYLWKALAAFNIPAEFINTVKSLYRTAETRVVINGHLSSRFRVTRGVRQGDPMSCILFDLAIEPLAASMQNSTLRGYEIPGCEEKLVANLFADDTTTFLSERDDMGTLQTLLDDWCIAAKAKFNISKTEMIPIETKEFRVKVTTTRRTRDGGDQIPNHMHIVTEGESVRILGAWFGNEADAAQPWAPIPEKIDAALENWSHSNPGMQGRKHIIQMVVGGMTQYLTQVQRMPKNIEKRLTKRIRKYMWGDEDKSSLVNEATMQAPIEMGGRGVLDLESRNQAIDVMWLKSYLDLGPDHAMWAYVADGIYGTKSPEGAKKEDGKPDPKATINPFIQSCKMSDKRKLKPELKSLLETAKTLQVRPEGLAFSRTILRQMLIWNHKEADPSIHWLNHSKASRCLRKKHKVFTVGEAERMARALTVNGHRPSATCSCPECKYLSEHEQCGNPHGCCQRARELLDKLPYKWDPRRVQPEDYEVNEAAGEDEDRWITFDRTVTTTGHLAEIFRIFTEGPATNVPADL